MKKYKQKAEQHLTQEPLVYYGLSNVSNEYLHNINSILGIKKNIDTEYDLIRLSRNGLHKSNVISLSKFLGITMEKMSELLNVSVRTFQRKENTESLSITTSFQTLEVAELAAKGLVVFGSQENFSRWLAAPLIALGGVAPVSMLDTTQGIKLISKLLGRIEHGIYS